MKVLVQTINQDHSGFTEGQEPSKVDEVEIDLKPKCKRKQTNAQAEKYTGWPMTKDQA